MRKGNVVTRFLHFYATTPRPIMPQHETIPVVVVQSLLTFGQAHGITPVALRVEPSSGARHNRTAAMDYLCSPEKAEELCPYHSEHTENPPCAAA